MCHCRLRTALIDYLSEELASYSPLHLDAMALEDHDLALFAAHGAGRTVCRCSTGSMNASPNCTFWMNSMLCGNNACRFTTSKACWRRCSVSCNRSSIVAKPCHRWICINRWAQWKPCITNYCRRAAPARASSNHGQLRNIPSIDGFTTCRRLSAKPHQAR